MIVKSSFVEIKWMTSLLCNFYCQLVIFPEIKMTTELRLTTYNK